jgi:hypothetical protein
MSGDDPRTGQRDPVDPLALAEAVAAGRLGFAAAEAALWEARPNDQGRAANDVAELRDLVTAIRAVRRHAEAVRKAEVEVFDPDAASMPLGSRGLIEDDREIGPRRVRGGDVRLRPGARQRQRWAPVGALAAAAVIVVAVALVGPGLLAPSVAGTPVATSGPSGIVAATPSASRSASPTPSSSSGPLSLPPTAAPTGVKGVPTIASEPIAGAPGIAYWTLTTETKVTITEWRPDGSAPRFRFTATTEADPSKVKRETDRRIVVSPDGSRMAFAESTGTFARTRVFATDGTLLWTDPTPTFTPDLAWSADGSRLVIGSQPATWKILIFKPAGGPPALQTLDFAGEAYRVLGFSQSGDVLYGWNTQGEADWWMTPIQVVIPNGKPISITTFSGKDEPLAISNGTTATSQVAPEDRSTTQVAGVDPQTYHVLDTGDLSGQLNGWEVRDVNTGAGKKLDGLGMDKALAWAGDGSIVVADVTHTDRAATITTVLPDAPGKPLTPTFSVPAGGYWRLLEGCRNGFALLGLAAARSGDSPWLGADELVLVELATARSSVLVPKTPGLVGLHPAGWITAP